MTANVTPMTVHITLPQLAINANRSAAFGPRKLYFEGHPGNDLILSYFPWFRMPGLPLHSIWREAMTFSLTTPGAHHPP